MLGAIMPRDAASSAHSPDGDARLDQAHVVLSALRDAARGLVESSPTPIRRAADLHRALGVDAPLGWQFFRVAMVVDPLAAVAYVPRAGSMQKILRQAEKGGWNAASLTAMAKAYEAFESFVREVAGTRGHFDAMIGALGNEAAEQIQARHRSAAFRANTRVWGVQVRTHYRAWIAYPGSRPRTEHSVAVIGWVDLRRLRLETVLGMRRGFMQDAGGGPAGDLSRTQVLEEFTTPPIPSPTTLAEANGASCEIVRFDRQQPGTPANFFGYQRFENVYDDEHQLWWGMKILSTLPAEVLLIDMLVPRGWADAATARVSTHGNLADVQSMYSETETFKLPASEEVQRLGSDLQALHTPDVPRCPELLGSVLQSIDCTHRDFEILRCRVRYPILHSLIWLKVSAQG